MKNWSKRWWVLALALLAVSGSSAFGMYAVVPGAAGAAVSPGAGVFNVLIMINTNAVAAGGFGDVIIAIEEGRDFTSPFATLAVQVAPTNPGQAALLAGGVPPFVVPAGFYPALPAGFVNAQFIYRSPNDPANPGWAAPLPGAAGQLDRAMASAHFVAEALSAHRAFIAAAPAGVMPWVNIRVRQRRGEPDLHGVLQVPGDPVGPDLPQTPAPP